MADVPSEDEHTSQADRYKRCAHDEEWSPVIACSEHRHEQDREDRAQRSGSATESGKRSNALAGVHITRQSLDIVHGELIAEQDDRHRQYSHERIVNKSDIDECGQHDHSPDNDSCLH